ncbi:MAG: leucine-rich repeat protein [Treponema sp.]|nr:leucine-rich repeat protein [Candidatus Treponema merdequi]
MKKIIRIFALGILAVFTGCTNFNMDLKQDRPVLNDSALISFSISNNEINSTGNGGTERTVYPTVLPEVLSDIQIIYKTPEESQYTKLGKYTSYSELSGAEVSVPAGTYDFKMTAEIGGWIYEGKISRKTLSNNEVTTLSFELLMTGAKTNTEGVPAPEVEGKGKLKIVVKIPRNIDVKAFYPGEFIINFCQLVQYGFKSIQPVIEGDYYVFTISEFETEENIFSEEIPAGIYSIFGGDIIDSFGNHIPTEINDTVYIADKCLSSVEYTIEASGIGYTKNAAMSGVCGEHAEFYLVENTKVPEFPVNKGFMPGKVYDLYITGYGDMYDYYPFEGFISSFSEEIDLNELFAKDSIKGFAPWNNFAINSVYVADEITRIGDCTFVSSALANTKSQVLNVMEVKFGKNSKLKSIGAMAFSYTAVNELAIPDSVTDIASMGFMMMPAAAKIVLPKGITEIKPASFETCPKLSSISIPSCVTKIGENAFGGCSKLAQVVFEKDSNKKCALKTIGNSAFLNCQGLTSINIPASVTEIGEKAFRNCKNLVSLSFEQESTLQTIGNSAFSGCSKLTNILIPSSVTTLGESAFSGCSGLYNVTFLISGEGNCGIKEIPDSAFANCFISNSTDINIPEGVEIIGNSAFAGCIKLSRITLPESLKEIKENAFASDTYLGCVVIPDGTSCKFNAEQFKECLIKAVYYQKIDDNYRAEYLDGLTSINNNSLHGLLSSNRRPYVTEIVVPASVEKIEKNAFNGAENLENLIVLKDEKTEKSNLKIFEGQLTSSAWNLPKFTVPSSVTSIAQDTFNGLTEIFFEDYKQTINLGKNFTHYAYENRYIVVPENATGDFVTGYSNAIISENLASDIYEDVRFYLEQMGEDDYKLYLTSPSDTRNRLKDFAKLADRPWNKFIDQIKEIEIGEGIRYVGEKAFNNSLNGNCIKVTVKSSFTEFGDYSLGGVLFHNIILPQGYDENKLGDATKLINE